MHNDTDTLLSERARTHGDYAMVAAISQQLKDILRSSPGWSRLNDVQRESLDMEASKNARILSGNPNEVDHWDDKAGYARLVSKHIAPPTAPSRPDTSIEDNIAEIAARYGANARLDPPTS